MKLRNKFLFGMSSVTSIVAPIVSVVACGDSKSYTTDITVKYMAADANINYSKNIFNFTKDSNSLKNILVSLDAKDITNAKFNIALNEVEAKLRAYAITLKNVNALEGETIPYWALEWKLITVML